MDAGPNFWLQKAEATKLWTKEFTFLLIRERERERERERPAVKFHKQKLYIYSKGVFTKPHKPQKPHQNRSQNSITAPHRK